MCSIVVKEATMVEYMLSTVDNPYNPFTEFERWWRYDVEHGYNSCAVLARVARLSDALTDEESARETKRAIDEIVKYDPLNVFIPVEREVVTHENEYPNVVQIDDVELETPPGG